MAAPDLSAHGVTVEPATKRHARLVGRQCRAADRISILSSGRWTDAALYARAQMNRSSEKWALHRNGQFLGVVGVMCVQRTADRPGYQYLWWLLTPQVEDTALLGAARDLVESFRDRYPLLLTMARANDPRTLGALESLGFSLMAPAPFAKSEDLWCKAALDTRKIEVVHG